MKVNEIGDRLEHDFFKYYKTVLINGPWGIGKTYYLKEYLHNKKIVYISLFGLNSYESFILSVYKGLDKYGAFIKKAINNNKNRDIGIYFLTIPIPNIDINIEKSIRKKIKDDNVIIVIDDLERKKSDIKMEDILGFIESLRDLENIKIIMVANEDKISEKDRKKFNDFKEKVIDVTYKIDNYSDEALNNICIQQIEKNPINNIISKDAFYEYIIKCMNDYKMNNLRIFKKSIIFTQMVLSNIEYKNLRESDKEELVRICFAVVNEINNGSSSELLNKSFEEKLIDHYYGKEFYTGKYDLVASISKIYNNENCINNYNKINNHYITKYSLSETEKDIFYCNQEEIISRLNNFNNNNIKKINKNLNISNWFSELNNLYFWIDILDVKNIFLEEDILSAADEYVKTIDLNNNLYSLIDKTIQFHFTNENIKGIYNKINKKIVDYYFDSIIKNINKSIKEEIYDDSLLDNMFNSLFCNSIVESDIKIKYINIIENYNYFIPNLNFDIDETKWHWCHIIWKSITFSNDESIMHRFINYNESLKKQCSSIGWFRIESLNEQYFKNLLNG